LAGCPTLDANMERALTIKNILGHWSKQAASQENSTEEDCPRRTAPDAPMTLLLRIKTEAGPRTVVATGIPLMVASDVAREMLRAGHFADYIDECPRLSVADQLKRRKLERAAASKSRTVIKLADRAAAPLAQH
jgi:hypothetical protein